MYKEINYLKNVMAFLESEDREIFFIDTETTGLQKDARIIEISIIKTSFKNGSLKTVDSIDRYIRPFEIISTKIEELTGITNDFLSHQKFEEEVFPEICEFLGEHPVLAAYNASFDVGKLEFMYMRQGKAFAPAAVIDVLELSRYLISTDDIRAKSYYIKKLEQNKGKPLSSHCLTVSAYMRGIKTDDIQFHNALGDTTVTVRLFENLYPDLKILLEDAQKKKMSVRVYSNRFYAGQKGYDKIYVGTDLGACVYDCYYREWLTKDFDLKDVDMEFIIAQVKQRNACLTMKEVIAKLRKEYKEKKKKEEEDEIKRNNSDSDFDDLLGNRFMA